MLGNSMDSSGRADGGKDTNVSRAFQILEEATRAGPLSQKNGQFRTLAIGSSRTTSKTKVDSNFDSDYDIENKV